MAVASEIRFPIPVGRLQRDTDFCIINFHEDNPQSQR